MTKKFEWNLYGWGNGGRGICKATDDPWLVFELDRSIAIEHKATIHEATEEQANEVLEVLLV